MYNIYIREGNYLLFKNASMNALKINKGLYIFLRKINRQKLSLNKIELVQSYSGKFFVESLIHNKVFI